MSRTEADAWAAGSAFTEPVFHVTASVSAAAIRRVGFDLGYLQFGRAFGDGVYMTPSSLVASRYERMFRNSGVAAEILELRIDLRHLLTVHQPSGSGTDVVTRILNAIPAGLSRYVEQIVRLTPTGLDAVAQARALSLVVSAAGYDALHVIDEGFTPRIGGTQIVVWDPKRIVVIHEEPATT